MCVYVSFDIDTLVLVSCIVHRMSIYCLPKNTLCFIYARVEFFKFYKQINLTGVSSLLLSAVDLNATPCTPVCICVCLDPLAAFYKCLLFCSSLSILDSFFFCLYFRLTSLLISEHIQEQNKSGAQPAQPMQHSQSCRSGKRRR